MFRNITGKLGNMRKAVEWTVYSADNAEDIFRTIQCDKRIAKVNLETKKVVLSDGKGGHQGFFKLNKIMGAIEYDCPQEIIDQLKNLDDDHGKQVGAVVLHVGSNNSIQARTEPVNIFDL